MINATAASAFNSSVTLEASATVRHTTLSNPQAAILGALLSSSNCDSKYLDVFATAMPNLQMWPAYRGLVIIEDGRAQRYDAQGSNPVQCVNDYDQNDIVVIKEATRYTTVHPSGTEASYIKEGIGFIRAVLEGLNGTRLDDQAEDELIENMKTQLTDYISRHGDDFKDVIGLEDRPCLASQPKSSTHSKLSVVPMITKSVEAFSDQSAPVTVARTVEASDSKPQIGKPSMINMVMNQMTAMLAPLVEAIRAKLVTPNDVAVSATILRMANRTMATAQATEKAVWIERCLQELFSADASSFSKAESILKYRHQPALHPVVDELMTFMETAAQELEGEALVRFADLLGASIAMDGHDRGIALEFSKEAARSSGSLSPFCARFESLRDKCGVSF